MDGPTAMFVAILVVLLGLLIGMIAHWGRVTQALNSNALNSKVIRGDIMEFACKVDLSRLSKDMTKLAFKEDVDRVER